MTPRTRAGRDYVDVEPDRTLVNAHERWAIRLRHTLAIEDEAARDALVALQEAVGAMEGAWGDPRLLTRGSVLALIDRALRSPRCGNDHSSGSHRAVDVRG